MRVSDVASKVAFKILSSVDLPGLGSNQHEFNGVSALKDFFGHEQSRHSARMIWCPDDAEEYQELPSSLTWYDARERNPLRSEHRLYYSASSSEVIAEAAVGDSIFFIQPLNGPLAVVLSPRESSVTRMLTWFFHTDDQTERFKVEIDLSDKPDRIAFLAVSLLERLGLAVPKAEDDLAEQVNKAFPDQLKWPTGLQLAQFAWDTTSQIDPINDPDETVMRWIESEYLAYRAVEQVRLGPKVRALLAPEGAVDLAVFRALALESLNRSKSRAGRSLELHIARILDLNHIKYSAQGTTEGKKRPDFLFPSMEDYHDPLSDPEKLFMLGAKRTLKDRWRQVLDEASKIPTKHLLTLDPSLTKDQITAITDANVVLVVPTPVAADYEISKRKSMMSVRDFVSLMKTQQSTL